MGSKSKTVRLPEELLKVIERKTRTENVNESTAIRHLLFQGAEEYAVELFKGGKITLNEAAELADKTVREMVDSLVEHGVRGNLRMDQQKKALEFVREATKGKSA
ncbi:hypothetical protein AKJ65_03620 [candidate division MSBL1 archaeon SCGC-AAA259E19]|uniref:Ribbon-helix-helix protein CopG domain-containing protein n=1 Tax=candidate division MSBL1 archaeon SCGC-AAA259E19 TaxID=1698264 RepID=A0A133UKI6_9EURY|nr:hypothetical protein AKJ65_03620 [candidate division MSBL1 archaeon SCGC-AAA259E19]